jgi:hypothetical protein
VTKEKLNLLKFASRSTAEASATATKIVRCQMVKANSFSVTFYRIPVPDAAHFREDSRNVVLFRSFGNRETISTFTVAAATRDQAEDLDFAPGQRFGRFGAGKIALNPIQVVVVCPAATANLYINPASANTRWKIGSNPSSIQRCDSRSVAATLPSHAAHRGTLPAPSTPLA